MSTRAARSTGETVPNDRPSGCLSCGKESLKLALASTMEMVESLWIAQTGKEFQEIVDFLKQPGNFSLTLLTDECAVREAQNCVFCDKPTRRIWGVLVDVSNRTVIGGVDQTCCDMASMTRRVGYIASLIQNLADVGSSEVTSIGDRLVEQIDVCSELTQKVRQQAVQCAQ